MIIPTSLRLFHQIQRTTCLSIGRSPASNYLLLVNVSGLQDLPQVLRKSMATLNVIDIGVNLTDEMYNGIYNGSKKHDPDLKNVLDRSWAAGLQNIFITAGNFKEAEAAVKLSRTDDRLFTTVGVHPTRCNEFDTDTTPEEYMKALQDVLEKNRDKIVAIGEFGLDYDRTKFCEASIQQKYFEYQLTELAGKAELPLFLHCRAAAADLHSILKRNQDCLQHGGVVHSFDGTIEEANLFLDLGLYIGINGCSLKTEENLAVVKQLPADKILLETDAPWCGMRSTHAGYKYVKTQFESTKKWSEKAMLKQRNEPQTIVNVLEAVAAVQDTTPEDLSSRIFQNTLDLFLVRNKRLAR